jgi:hypothetical protein
VPNTGGGDWVARIARHHRFLCALLLLFLGVAPTAARAQDAQVWGHAYGLRAQLLGGVTVGSVLDLSSTFYNPGATA